MECKQTVQPQTIYWASDPLRQGRFEVEGLEGGETKRASIHGLKPKSNLLTFPFQATSIHFQEIFNPFFFSPAKHGSPCSLHDETMSMKPWQEALVEEGMPSVVYSFPVAANSLFQEIYAFSIILKILPASAGFRSCFYIFLVFVLTVPHFQILKYLLVSYCYHNNLS